MTANNQQGKAEARHTRGPTPGPRNWNGYEFIRENGDVTHADWDFVIAQSTRPDPQYISEQQLATFGGKLIDRAEADRLHLAQWRAECAARGVVVRP